MSVDLKFDQKYLDSVMLSPAVEGVVESAAKRALAAARSSAPVDTGAYKRSLQLKKVRRRYRRAVLVESNDPKALIIEAKTGNLARSLKSAGRG